MAARFTTDCHLNIVCIKNHFYDKMMMVMIMENSVMSEKIVGITLCVRVYRPMPQLVAGYGLTEGSTHDLLDGQTLPTGNDAELPKL